MQGSAIPEDQKQGELDQQLALADPMRRAVCVTFHSDVDADLTMRLLSEQTVPVVDYRQFCASVLSPPSLALRRRFPGGFANRNF